MSINTKRATKLELNWRLVRINLTSVVNDANMRTVNYVEMGVFISMESVISIPSSNSNRVCHVHLALMTLEKASIDFPNMDEIAGHTKSSWHTRLFHLRRLSPLNSKPAEKAFDKFVNMKTDVLSQINLVVQRSSLLYSCSHKCTWGRHESVSSFSTYGQKSPV